MEPERSNKDSGIVDSKLEKPEFGKESKTFQSQGIVSSKVKFFIHQISIFIFDPIFYFKSKNLLLFFSLIDSLLKKKSFPFQLQISKNNLTFQKFVLFLPEKKFFYFS